MVALSASQTTARARCAIWKLALALLRCPPEADSLFATLHRAAAEAAGVPLVHYDRDYDRVATVTDLQHRWMVADGSLA